MSFSFVFVFFKRVKLLFIIEQVKTASPQIPLYPSVRKCHAYTILLFPFSPSHICLHTPHIPPPPQPSLYFALSLSLCVSPWSLLLSKCYEALSSVVIPRTQTTMGAPAELLVALMAVLCINAPGTSSNSFGLCVCCWKQCFQTTTGIYFKTVHSVRRWRMQWFSTLGEWPDIFPLRRAARDIPLSSWLQAPWIQKQQLCVRTLVPRHSGMCW